MSTPAILALHGFLGQPEDFQGLALPRLRTPSIFRTQICPLPEWAQRFNRLVRDRPILLGYSMGGRLALHCLLNDPSRFCAAVILAAHPGLSDPAKRLDRYFADIAWSKRFLKEPWDQLVRQWHEQPALASSAAVHRSEHRFDRESLALAMRYFSLGAQSFLTDELKQLSLPILWLNPAEESAKLAGLSLAHPLSRIISIARGGHRFMTAQPRATASLINQFINSVGISGRSGCFFGA